MTLRSRLLLGFGLVLAALAVSMVVVAATQRGYALDQLDRQLDSALPFAVRPPLGAPTGDPAVLPEDSSADSPASEFFVGIVDGGGEVTPIITGELLDDVPAIEPADLEALDDDGGTFTTGAAHSAMRFRVRAARLPDGDSWGVVALSLDEVDAANRSLLVALGIAGSVIVVVLGVAGWWMYRLGLRPISKVTAVADSIAAGDRAQRVDPDRPGTEAARLAQAFNVMLDQRDAQEQTLRRFVADASHELRTPLTSVRGYLEVYDHGGFGAAGELDDVVRRMRSETERMTCLVEDLLLLANLDEGRPLRREPVDLVDVIGDAASDGRAVQPERSITTTVAADHLMVEGDESSLRQVLGSLVHNALVHTPTTASIALEAGRDDGVITVSVTDTGPGLPSEVVAQVFDRFYRSDSSRSRHAGGAGLGLSIARSIVEAHGGSIGVESASPGGTTFWIRLPVTEAAGRPAPPGDLSEQL